MFEIIGQSWSGRRDLNPRPLAPQASALTRLRYAPTIFGKADQQEKTSTDFLRLNQVLMVQKQPLAARIAYKISIIE